MSGIIQPADAQQTTIEADLTAKTPVRLLCYLEDSESARGMPFQPELFPGSPAARNGTNPHAPAEPQPEAQQTEEAQYQPAPVWLQRLSLFVLVVFCVYLGVIVTVLPWWTAVWDHNLFLRSHPQLWAILSRGPARGVISGLGLLDIWIGISEAIHYHDQRR